VIDAMGTATPSSPADATLERAQAFLRVMHDGLSGARQQQPSVEAEAADLLPSDERQMSLPHVQMDTPTSTTPAEAAAQNTPVEKTIWGSPAGKKHLAPRLVKLIPPHKTYVEPFAGSGAVFFEKPPSEKEVLGDADPDIAFAYKALVGLTDAELAALKKKDWTGSRTLFRAMQEAKPRTKAEKLYRFLYLSHFAYGKLRGKSYNPNAEGIAARTIDRIEKHRDRLRNVTVRSAHYADVVKEFDGKDTFFFLDPPYPGHNVDVGEDRFDEVEFRKVLDGIKGKFLVTYGTRGELETTGFQVRMIRTRRTISSMRGVGGPKTLPQLLIANYAIAQKSLGPYEFDVVEAAVELTPDVAADLDLARVLAKALAEETGVSSVCSLVDELDRFDDVTGGRAALLARELLPIGTRLAPAIKAEMPEFAGRWHDVQPELEDLAKARWSRALIDDLPNDAFTADKKKRLQGRARRLLEEAQRGIEKTNAASALAAIGAGEAAGLLTLALAKRIPLLKTDEERYVLGVVLEPETVDAQDDIYSAAEVRDAAHRFMEQYQNIGLMHRGLVNGRVKILESYLAPTPFSLDGARVQKGTWLLAVRVLDEELWGQIKNGELTGLSIGGSAARVSDPAARGDGA
jgi:site-specific DNA-adenine methylase